MEGQPQVEECTGLIPLTICHSRRGVRMEVNRTAKNRRTRDNMQHALLVLPQTAAQIIGRLENLLIQAPGCVIEAGIAGDNVRSLLLPGNCATANELCHPS